MLISTPNFLNGLTLADNSGLLQRVQQFIQEVNDLVLFESTSLTETALDFSDTIHNFVSDILGDHASIILSVYETSIKQLLENESLEVSQVAEIAEQLIKDVVTIAQSLPSTGISQTHSGEDLVLSSQGNATEINSGEDLDLSRSIIVTDTDSGENIEIFVTGIIGNEYELDDPSFEKGLSNSFFWDDAESNISMGLTQFRADSRFAGIDGSKFTVVILDTGIDLDHTLFGPDAFIPMILLIMTQMPVISIIMVLMSPVLSGVIVKP
jgi:hypothetical protein